MIIAPEGFLRGKKFCLFRMLCYNIVKLIKGGADR